MDIEHEIFKAEFSNHELDKSHMTYERETAFYQSIKMGNTKEALSLFLPLNSDFMGKLSNSLEEKLFRLTEDEQIKYMEAIGTLQSILSKEEIG